MASSTHVIISVLFCVSTIYPSKQDEGCVPGAISNLTLRGTTTFDILTWVSPPDEKCELYYYIAEITAINGTLNLIYRVRTPIVQINHLERCEEYTFRVFPVSTDNITGPEVVLHEITPPNLDANLALDYIRLTQEGKNVRLDWSLEPDYIRCAKWYRVLVYNEDTDEPEDIYTSLTSIVLNDIVPCGHYTFGVRALFNLDEEGPLTLIRHTADDYVTTAPRLAGLIVDDTSITFTWHLEEYSKNRCPISTVNLNGNPYFNVAYIIADQENRTPLTFNSFEF